MIKVSKILFVLLLLLNSCVGKREYDDIDIKPTWSENNSHIKDMKASLINKQKKDAEYSHEWWKNYNDCILNNLIQTAIENNLDFKTAYARVKEARANQANAGSKIFPKINAEESVSRSNQISNFNGSQTGNKQIINLFNGGLNATWELDIFGVNRNFKDAQTHQLYAIIADADHFLVTLISDVIINYIEYRKYQNILKVINKEIGSRKEIFGMVKSRFEAGLASDIEVQEASAAYLSIESKNSVVAYQIAQAQYALETLCGLHINALAKTLKSYKPIPTIKTKITANTPLYIVQNRPDIIKAEQELLSSTSLTKSAIASQYPNVSLSGMLGYQRSNVLPNKTVWNIGQSLVMPLIDFNQIRSQIDAQSAKEEQAFFSYHSTVLRAMQEIELTFVKYLNAYKNYNTMKASLANNRRSFELSKHLYQSSSTISYIELLEAQQKLLDSEVSEISALAEFAETSAFLYKVLGYSV